MKRRRSSKRKREQGPKFSFAKLEPRKLLAADGIFSASMDTDFADPIFVETIEQVCVVHSDESGDGEIVESNELQGNLQDEVQTEACGDTSHKDVDENSSQEDGSNEADSFGDSNVRFNFPSRVVFSNAFLNPIEGDLTFGFQIDADTEITQGVPEASVTLVYDAPISLVRNDLAEAEPLEVRTEPQSDEGAFNETTDSEPAGRELGTVETEDSPRVGMLAQRQLFALISPTEIERAESPTSMTAKTADSSSNLHSLTTRTRTVPAIEQIQTGDLGGVSDSAIGPQRTPVINVKTPFKAETRSTDGVAPTGSLPAHKVVEQAVSGSKTFLPYAVLDQLFGSYGTGDQRPADKNSPAVQGASDESTADDRVARSVQIVESAIILIGLPSSRVCRDGEAKGKPGV